MLPITPAWRLLLAARLAISCEQVIYNVLLKNVPFWRGSGRKLPSPNYGDISGTQRKRSLPLESVTGDIAGNSGSYLT
jgi:hypothetical protein